MKWKPIETSPKDGSEFLALTDYGKRCVMRFSGGEIRRVTTCRRCDGMGLGGLTYWHPLPEPPCGLTPVAPNAAPSDADYVFDESLYLDDGEYPPRR